MASRAPLTKAPGDLREGDALLAGDGSRLVLARRPIQHATGALLLRFTDGTSVLADPRLMVEMAP